MTQSERAYGGDLIESLKNHLAEYQPPFLEEDIETQWEVLNHFKNEDSLEKLLKVTDFSCYKIEH